MDLEQTRYSTFEELELYCYRVAGTVGLMTQGVMGIDPAYTTAPWIKAPDPSEAAIALGVANDAGGGHLLGAGGRPLITLFGRTSAHKFKPPYCKQIAITAQEFGGTEMELIPVSRVALAIEAVIGGVEH